MEGGRKTIKIDPVFKKLSRIPRSKGQRVCGLDLKGTPTKIILYS